MGLNVGGGTKLLEKWDEVEPTYVGYIQYIEDKSISGHFSYVMVLAHSTYVAKKSKEFNRRNKMNTRFNI